MKSTEGRNGTEETSLFHYTEQSDNEFTYNWVVDMNWKMFSTVLGEQHNNVYLSFTMTFSKMCVLNVVKYRDVYAQL